jgi:hypothetical protein
MDALTLVAEIIKAVAWPLAALGLALLFRKAIINLVSGQKLHEVDLKAFAVKFSEGVQQVKASLPALPPATTPVTRTLTTKLDVHIASDPVEEILKAWNDVEGLLAAAVAQGIAPSGFVLTDVVDTLVGKGILQQSTRASIISLYHLRNLAAHAPAERLTPLQVQEFVTMAQATRWVVEQDLKKHQTASGAR